MLDLSNESLLYLLGSGMVLYMIGMIRNTCPPIPDKTRWGWFVLGLPMVLYPFGVAVSRTGLGASISALFG